MSQLLIESEIKELMQDKLSVLALGLFSQTSNKSSIFASRIVFKAELLFLRASYKTKIAFASNVPLTCCLILSIRRQNMVSLDKLPLNLHSLQLSLAKLRNLAHAEVSFLQLSITTSRKSVAEKSTLPKSILTHLPDYL